MDTSILIGLVMTVRFLCWVAGLLIRLLALWRAHGPGWHLAGIVLPAILHWLHLRPPRRDDDVPLRPRDEPQHQEANPEVDQAALRFAPHNALAVQVAHLQEALDQIRQERGEPEHPPRAPPLP